MVWKRKGKADGRCSMCSKDFTNFGFNTHNQYKHEGHAELMPFSSDSMIKKPESLTSADKLVDLAENLPYEEPEEVHGSMKGWVSKTRGVQIGYRPVPIAQVILNQLRGAGRGYDEVINAALIHYARSLGFEPAMITTTGGQQFKLMGESKEQRVVDNMVKIAEADAKIRRSESELNPVMLAAAEDDGMDMGEMMKMMMMMKMFGDD